MSIGLCQEHAEMQQGRKSRTKVLEEQAMDTREARLGFAIVHFMRLSFQDAQRALENREDILLGEIFENAEPTDQVAIRAAPIQALGTAPDRQIELAVILVDGAEQVKRYVYIGENGTVEAPPEIQVNSLSWRQ